MENDPINPNHYHSGGTEPIDYMRERLKELPLPPFAAGCWMAVMKYLSRMGLKGPAKEDGQKAQKYLEWLIEDLS